MGCRMLDAGRWMWDASLQSQPSFEAGRDCRPCVQQQTRESHLAQEPAWMEAGAIRKIRHMYSYIFYKTRKPSPCLRGFWRGRALCEKPGGDKDVSPGRRPVFPLPVPRAIHGGSEVPSAARPRVHGGLGTTVAQVKAQRCSPRKAHTAHTIPLPLWPGGIIHPYRSKQHLHQGSNSPPLCTGNTSLT